MSKIFILSGTTEGRTLAEGLEKAGVKHYVSVASEYGKNLMEDSGNRTTHVGRMDAVAMEKYLLENGFAAGDFLVDATHPYATEVSQNAKAVCGKTGLQYLRIKREKADLTAYKNIKIYDSMEELAKALTETGENILLTTGSKEIEIYASTVSGTILKNTYVRVLPTVESLEKCKAFGIEESHIIALHGPFDEALNEALLRQFAIRHMITKESGKEGGFEEKLKACEKLSVTVHIIARPQDEDGVSVEEALKRLGAEVSFDSPKEDKGCRIILAGAGMGDQKNLTTEVFEAVKDADVLFGAKRLIDGFDKETKYPLYRAEEVLEVLKEHPEMKNAVVLFSGDSGFYSGAKSFARVLKEEGYDGNVRILPGISSISYLAARCKTSYEDAVIYSLHGRFSETALYELGEKIAHCEKNFVLFSGDSEVRALGKELKEREFAGDIILGINLSSAEERILTLSADALVSFEGEGSITGLVLNSAPEKRKLVPVFSDADFQRDKVPMTKEVIRHESIRRLGLCEGDLVYDIGGGTGSVAIETALLHPSLRVTTIEKKEEAVLLLKKNAEAHRAVNLQILEGDAAEILPSLPKPDCVFIGGSGGKLEEIMEILTGKGVGIHFVLNAVTMETIKEIEGIIEKYKPEDLVADQISVSSLDTVGSYHMFKAQNPVMIYSFTI